MFFIVNKGQLALNVHFSPMTFTALQMFEYLINKSARSCSLVYHLSDVSV